MDFKDNNEKVEKIGFFLRKITDDSRYCHEVRRLCDNRSKDYK